MLLSRPQRTPPFDHGCSRGCDVVPSTSRVAWANQQNRNTGMLEDGSRDAAEYKPLNAGSPVGRHRNKIDMGVLNAGHDLLRRSAKAHGRHDMIACSSQLLSLS